jgi:NAD-dependent SIR2 family protein deacetylase
MRWLGARHATNHRSNAIATQGVSNLHLRSGADSIRSTLVSNYQGVLAAVRCRLPNPALPSSVSRSPRRLIPSPLSVRTSFLSLWVWSLSAVSCLCVDPGLHGGASALHCEGCMTPTGHDTERDQFGTGHRVCPCPACRDLCASAADVQGDGLIFDASQSCLGRQRCDCLCTPCEGSSDPERRRAG